LECRATLLDSLVNVFSRNALHARKKEQEADNFLVIV
jgi:hypothetical protein